MRCVDTYTKMYIKGGWGGVITFPCLHSSISTSIWCYVMNVLDKLLTCSWCYVINCVISPSTCFWCYVIHFVFLLSTSIWCYVMNFWSAWWLNAFRPKRQIVWGHLKNNKMSAFTNGIKVWRHFNQWHGHVQRQKKLTHAAQCNCAEKRTDHFVVLHLNHGRLWAVDLGS